jgi:uncharacterized linocin/CFP29 family protein
MPTNNLNRDQLWTSDVWEDIDNAVLAEACSIRVAQKVFPTVLMTGASNVPAEVFHPDTMSIDEGRAKPFLEISVEFRVTQSQADNEATLHTTRTLAKLAVKSLALAEDKLIFEGARAQIPQIVRVVNRESAEGGLLADAHTIEVESPNRPTGISGDHIFRAVTEGIARLIERAQPGPYGLFLESSLYADAYAPFPGTLVNTTDRLIPLLQGGFYGTGTLPKSTALLVSLGGEPTTLFLGTDAVTAYTQEDMEGRQRFRVFERIQFVARDHHAFIRLVFHEKK